MEEKEPIKPEAKSEGKVNPTPQTAANKPPANPVPKAPTENKPPVNAAPKVPQTPNKVEPVTSTDSTDLQEKEKKSDSLKNIERLLDVEMNVTVRFGKTEIPLREAVNFGIGSMIELNRSVDEPVDLLVNNFPFARGEVVVIDGYYGVRVTEIGTPEERSNALLKNAS